MPSDEQSSRALGRGLIVGTFVGAAAGITVGIAMSELLYTQSVNPETDGDAGLIYGIVLIIDGVAGFLGGAGSGFLVTAATHVATRRLQRPAQTATRAWLGALSGGVATVALSTALLLMAGPLTSWAVPTLATGTAILLTAVAVTYQRTLLSAANSKS